jgi:uncharacterized membrane protein YkoI
VVIDQDTALEIARQRAKENGWGFFDPVNIENRVGWLGRSKRFEIETNAGKLGTKAKFVIDAETGAIISEGYIPR